jgi:hypothetical protein
VAAPNVDVSARRGDYAADAAAAPSTPAAVVPTVVSAELARLARLRADAEVFSYAVPTSAGATIVVELSTTAAARAPFRGGAEVRVSVTGAAGPEPVVRLAAGARSALVPVAIDRARPGPWTATVTVAGDGDRLQDQVTVPMTNAAIIGAPMAWRAMPSPRSPLVPLADFQLHRAERLHVEWPILREPASRIARLLDRRGQPLGAELPLTVAAERRALALDLPMAALPEGDFLVDVTAEASGQTERQVLAFRVVR